MGRRAFFVAISLALAAAAWPGQPPDVAAAVPSVPLRLPYDADEQVRWTGGPHVYYCSRNCLLPIGDDTLNLYRTGEGSGLDFSNGGNFDVLAMAAGHVIYATGQAADDPDRVACSTSGLGCRIATRLADGTVIVYAHLLDGSVHVHAGDELEQGRVLAQAGQSGGQSYVHLHIEWRDGSGSWPDGSDGNCGQDDPRCFYGNPIGWEGHPLGLDGYRIWPFLCTAPIRDAPQADCSGDGEVAFDYDGSATVGQVKTIEACTFGDGLAGTTRRQASVAVDATYRQTICDTTEPGMPTQFAGRGAIGAGAGDGPFVQGTVDPGGGYLVSTNRRIGGSPATVRPKVVWVKKGTTKDASHVPYGEPVTLVTRFHGDVDVAGGPLHRLLPRLAQRQGRRQALGLRPQGHVAHAQGLPARRRRAAPGRATGRRPRCATPGTPPPARRSARSPVCPRPTRPSR